MPLSEVWEDSVLPNLLARGHGMAPAPPHPRMWNKGPHRVWGAGTPRPLPTLPFVLALWPSKCQLASPQIRAGISPLSLEGMSPPTPHPR